MIETAEFIEAALDRGFSFFSGVPCSFLKPLINSAIRHTRLTYVATVNEGDAVATGSGAVLGGARAFVMFQNSGLGNAVNPLTSLNYIFNIPLLLIITLRGKPGTKDEPQHELMGRTTATFLENMEIPYRYFPTEDTEIQSSLDQAITHMDQKQRPFALIMNKGSSSSVALSHALDIPEAPSTKPKIFERWTEAGSRPTRQEALTALIEATPEDETAVVSTTGYTSRELFALKDRPNQFYMVGSMGCASSLGLGLAMQCPQKKVVVVDGDGALLMRMGSMATIGHYSPPNLVHILLDNEVYESTGGQRTVSDGISWNSVAAGCRYRKVIAGDQVSLVQEAVADLGKEGPLFLHLKIQPGVPEDLPRPNLTPVEVKERFISQL